MQNDILLALALVAGLAGIGCYRLCRTPQPVIAPEIKHVDVVEKPVILEVEAIVKAEEPTLEVEKTEEF